MIKNFGPAYKKVKKINFNIKKFTKKKEFIFLILRFSKIFNLPKNIIEKETWIILSKNFDYKNNRVLKLNSFINFLKSSILLLSLSIFFILNFFFTKKGNKKFFYDILIDGALSHFQAERFKELCKNFNKVCFISKKEFFKKKNVSYFNYRNFLFKKNEFSFLKRINFFLFVCYLFIISFISFKNYFFIFLEIFYKFLKYDYIFKSIIAKSYIQSKSYDTSALKNYIFKKNGGNVTSCTQQNLIEVGLSSFIFTDIYFSIGKNTANLLKKLDGSCKNIYPVGSLYMEGDWFKKSKDIKQVKKTDLLVLGINTVKRHYKLHVTESFDKNYYKFIHWIKEISNKFPKIKIAIKHHGNFPHDSREFEILKNSRVKIETISPSKNGSYANAFKSKVLCSFGSTMIFEFLGHNVPGFFLDPNYENQQFFEMLPQSNKWRLKSYNEFEKTVIPIVNGKKVKIKNKEYYCLKSDKVSKRISLILKKY